MPENTHQDPRATRGLVFGAKEDVLVFALPALAALGLVALFTFTRLNRSAPAHSMVIFAFLVLLDKAHVYSTVFRTYADGAVRQRWRRSFTLVPIAVIAILSVIAFIDRHAAGHLVAWFAIYHFVRQQYGWMAWATASARDTRWARLLSLAMIYNATLFPIIWAMSHGGAAWFLPGDFPDLFPEIVGEALVPLHILITIAFLVKGGLTRTKAYIAASTWLAWCLPFIFLPTRHRWFMGMILQTLVHGVPYLLLLYRYARRRFTIPGTWTYRAANGPGIGVSYIVFCLAAVIESLGVTWLMAQPVTADIGPALGLGVVFALLSTMQVTHFVLDAYIWRRSLDPSLGKLLAVQASVATPAAPGAEERAAS